MKSLGRILPKHERGPRCKGRKKCRKKACYTTVFGQLVCQPCFMQFKRSWYQANGTTLKAAKKQHRRHESSQTEPQRRAEIFAQWHNPELDRLRRTPEYKEWRIAVLERDQYKCQHCKRVGRKLHAHHLKSFKMYPELRYKVDNGICLCAGCHEDLHIKNYDKAHRIVKLKA